MKQMLRWSWMALVVCGACISAVAEEIPAVLNFGDAMPAVTGVEWLRGADPLAVEESARPRFVVYDCWASWCGPCMQSIPHLSELADKYSNRVAIAGIAVWDDLDNIRKVLEKKGEAIRYAIGFDAAGSVAEKVMKGAGQDGIPCAFIVNTASNTILWFGHPMTMDAVLQQVVDGTYDPGLARRNIECEKEIQSLMSKGSWDEAQQKVDEWKAFEPDKAAVFSLWIQVQLKNVEGTQRALNAVLTRGVPPEESLNIMGLMVLALDRFPESKELQAMAVTGAGKIAGQHQDDVMLQGMYWYALNAAGQYDDARAVADRMLELSWDNPDKLTELADGMLMDEVSTNYFAQAEKAIRRVRELSSDPSSVCIPELKLAALRGDDVQVEKTAGQLLALETVDPELVNTAAWELLTNKRIDKDYTSTGLALAEKAEGLTMGENPAILDTLALAEFRSGRVERAIEIEKNAIELAPQYDFLKMQLAMFEDAQKTNQPDAQKTNQSDAQIKQQEEETGSEQ